MGRAKSLMAFSMLAVLFLVGGASMGYATSSGNISKAASSSNSSDDGVAVGGWEGVGFFNSNNDLIGNISCVVSMYVSEWNDTEDIYPTINLYCLPWSQTFDQAIAFNITVNHDLQQTIVNWGIYKIVWTPYVQAYEIDMEPITVTNLKTWNTTDIMHCHFEFPQSCFYIASQYLNGNTKASEIANDLVNLALDLLGIPAGDIEKLMFDILGVNTNTALASVTGSGTPKAKINFNWIGGDLTEICCYEILVEGISNAGYWTEWAINVPITEKLEGGMCELVYWNGKWTPYVITKQTMTEWDEGNFEINIYPPSYGGGPRNSPIKISEFSDSP